MLQQISIQPMKSDDLEFALHLVEGERWEVGRAELELLLECEPKGCFIAQVGEQRIGMVTTTSYSPVGWIGSLIVEPEGRGRGIGSALMRQAMQYLARQGVKTIRLDAEQRAVPLYRRLGFVQESRSLRFRGQGTRQAVQNVQAMQLSHFDEVRRLDARGFGADRSRILRRVFRHAPELCFVAYTGRELAGYIMAKRVAAGGKIGPWICRPEALDTASAKGLLQAVLNALDGQPVSVGVLENNQLSQELLREHGFHETPHSPRMRWGEDCCRGDPAASLAIGAASKG